MLQRPEELALQICFLSDRDSVAAWQEFDANYTLDDLCPHAVRLIPHLDRKLRSLGILTISAGTMSGVRKRTWYKNQVVLKELVQYLSLLDRAGIEAIANKTTARVLRFDPHNDSREIKISRSWFTLMTFIRQRGFCATWGWIEGDLMLQAAFLNCSEAFFQTVRE